ncbi:GAF and ANTAR domain-containing protein [Streptomyces sp. VRA16 Mangrove soil]|uniref:ANTAR domain-containing protein n=1 Tax=Streptomyces sp. VRA16 Mangrove soil TaxID=2817434 RepID=UPI001A9DFDF4|nr:GAF and ANTAR domain-containing protein [Streptomyces sp. VRA16 Mangrove soil]MBO1332129.1 ANTAR domain-containing protein [Streptomyces sp. VRA16 Mangrove soil]
MLRDVELASAAARLTGEASREPAGVERVLAVFVESVRYLADVDGAAVHCVSCGGAAARTEATSRELRALTAEEAAWAEGPGHAACTTGRAIVDLDVTPRPALVRWPRWVPRARALGIGRVTALPLAVPDGPVGSLVLVNGTGLPLDARTLDLARTLTQMTASVLFLQRQVLRNLAVIAQLEHALDSRVVIEQAKGMLSVLHGIPLDDAFALLRNHARSHRRKITEIAQEITENRSPLPSP